MKTVLIIEDDTAIRENCAEILELAGYHVLVTDNGRVGVELAVQYKPDIIICDIMKPELDGFGVLFYLEKIPRPKKYPLFF